MNLNRNYFIFGALLTIVPAIFGYAYVGILLAAAIGASSEIQHWTLPEEQRPSPFIAMVLGSGALAVAAGIIEMLLTSI